VLGDSVYGEGWERGMGGPNRGWAKELARRTPRQFLHAVRLGFEHPATGQSMRFRSPLPADLEAVARWAEASDSEGEGPS
jgi:23S rRNA pseudouridine1911/1915/1917 synthase